MFQRKNIYLLPVYYFFGSLMGHDKSISYLPKMMLFIFRVGIFLSHVKLKYFDKKWARGGGGEFGFFLDFEMECMK